MKVISDIRIYRSFLRIGDRSYMQKRLQEMCVDVLVLRKIIIFTNLFRKNVTVMKLYASLVGLIL